jgi:SNF2 family DNA or RNA helicase
MTDFIPFPHQLEALEFFRSNPYCACFSEPGVGKTLSAILLIKEYAGRAIVVCPSLLTRNWQKELRKFAGIESVIYPFKGQLSCRVIIISSDMIYKCPELFHGVGTVVVDESHMFLTMTARRTKALHSHISQFVPSRLILMTGTPLKGKVTELYSTLRLIDYGPIRSRGFNLKFKSQWAFNLTFANMVKKRVAGREITTFEGSKNTEALKLWLKGTYIKHKLADLEDLPEVIFTEIELAQVPKEKKRLQELDDNLEKGWEAYQLGEATPTSMATLKMEAAIAKAPDCIEYVKNAIAAQDLPIVVFTDHVLSCFEVCAAIPNSAYIRGDTPMAQRDDTVKRFQAGEIDVLVATIGSASVGITLTRSNHLVFMDLSYEPHKNTQAVGRIRRMTQTRKCRVVTLVRPGIDTRVSRILLNKEAIIQEVMND